jgi:hypothetical protein
MGRHWLVPRAEGCGEDYQNRIMKDLPPFTEEELQSIRRQVAELRLFLLSKASLRVGDGADKLEDFFVGMIEEGGRPGRTLRIRYASITGLTPGILTNPCLECSSAPMARLSWLSDDGGSLGMPTTIQWTNETWNPSTGCDKVSAGCKNCYAEKLARRFPKTFPNGFKFTLRPKRFRKPLSWHKPRMVFVNSMSDLFHEEMRLYSWKNFLR